MNPSTTEYIKKYKGPYKTVVISKNTENLTEYVNNIPETVEEHTVVSFETGKYFLKDAFILDGKKDIVI